MVSFKKIWVATVTVAFVFTVISPVCCAEHWSNLVGHAHKTSDHNHSHDDASGCDIPLLKILSKPDIISANYNPWMASFAIPFDSRMYEHIPKELKDYSPRLIFFNKAGPPIHLMNGVFLN